MSLTKQSRHPCIAQHALCPLSAVTFGNNIYVEITVKHSIVMLDNHCEIRYTVMVVSHCCWLRQK